MIWGRGGGVEKEQILWAEMVGNEERAIRGSKAMGGFEGEDKEFALDLGVCRDMKRGIT